MTITKNIDGTNVVMVVEGRLDTSTAPELEKEVKGVVPNADSLCFDFEKLEYISSAGLRVLLSSQKLMSGKGGSMVVRNINETVAEVFEITGFSDFLTIE